MADSLLPSERVRTLAKSRLRISDVGASDNGVYSCSARNDAGVVDSRGNFILNVHGIIILLPRDVSAKCGVRLSVRPSVCHTREHSVLSKRQNL